MTNKELLKRCQKIIRLANSYGINNEKIRIQTLVSLTTLNKIISGDKLKDSTLETFMSRWLEFVDGLQSKTIEIYKK